MLVMSNVAEWCCQRLEEAYRRGFVVLDRRIDGKYKILPVFADFDKQSANPEKDPSIWLYEFKTCPFCGLEIAFDEHLTALGESLCE